MTATAKLSIRMIIALESSWTDREGVTRIDHTCARMVTMRALQARGLVKQYSHELTEGGKSWLSTHKRG